MHLPRSCRRARGSGQAPAMGLSRQQHRWHDHQLGRLRLRCFRCRWVPRSTRPPMACEWPPGHVVYDSIGHVTGTLMARRLPLLSGKLYSLPAWTRSRIPRMANANFHRANRSLSEVRPTGSEDTVAPPATVIVLHHVCDGLATAIPILTSSP